ncbi:hypothetical protein F4818DRAFT_303761 [Hypoxylon cercidicola]|nr:hypothetical protein F4818DRAFT_303761 [Hypoxylon cercidicola]
MPKSSRFAWLKRRLRRGTEEEEDKDVDKRIAAACIASAKMSSVAAIAVLNAVNAALHARHTESTAHLRSTGRHVALDLKSVATAVSDFVRDYAKREAVNRVKIVLSGPHNEAAATAITAAAVDIVRAVAGVIKDHIAAVAPTIRSALSVEKLALAAAAAATQASRAVADAIVLVDKPPSYEGS